MATQHGIPVRPDNLLIVDVQHPELHLFHDNAILGKHIQVQLALALLNGDHRVHKLMHMEQNSKPAVYLNQVTRT